MKNILKIFIPLFCLVAFTSCDEEIEPSIQNGNEAQNRTFLGFTQAAYNLPVTIDDTGSLTVPLNASTISSADRTYNIVLDAEASTADPMTYTLPSSITIPANSYQGTMEIIGMDNDLVDAEIKTIVFSLEGAPDNVDMDTNVITVNVFEVCPVPDDYLVGSYTIADSNGNFPVGETVTVSVGNTSEERVFETTFLPGTGVATVVPVRFTLACNVFNLSADIDISVSCTAGNPPFYILTSAAADNSTYSLASDMVHTINYREDPFTSCAATSTIQNFTLTNNN